MIDRSENDEEENGDNSRQQHISSARNDAVVPANSCDKDGEESQQQKKKERNREYQKEFRRRKKEAQSLKDGNVQDAIKLRQQRRKEKNREYKRESRKRKKEANNTEDGNAHDIEELRRQKRNERQRENRKRKKEAENTKDGNASSGWLRGFKKRYGIQSIRKKEEKLPNNPSSPAEFRKTLRAKIELENLNLANIYNADESGILWRLLRACTLALQVEEQEASVTDEYKDRLTALFCANASGSHRIPLLIIGKSETPKCLRNLLNKTSEDHGLRKLKRLGVTYTYQNNAWMDKFIFMQWYKDEFIPRVLERQNKDGITGKVVLLLDNAPSHPSLDELNAINENFEAVYLPPNETALIQPMDQGLITTTKKLYKKIMLRHLFLGEKSEGAVQFLQKLNLRDCFGMLSLAWCDVKSSTLQKAWKPLLEDSFNDDASANIDDPLFTDDASASVQDPLYMDDAVVGAPASQTDLISFPYEICNEISELLSGPDYSVEKSREFLLKWFENDHNDSNCGWESSSDRDIENLVTNNKCEPEIVTEIEKSKSFCENPEPMEVTTSEAFDNFMKFKSWLNSGAECLPKYLDYIRELEKLIDECTKHDISQNKEFFS